jgi:hypothetical protein
MKDVAAETAQKTAAKSGNTAKDSGESTALDRRYGQIGISAVAAAARYIGMAKNTAYAPAPSGWLDRADEAA